MQLLRKWVKVVENALLGLTIFETILVVIIGVASSNIYHEKYSNIYIGILISSAILYLITIGFKVLYDKRFPSSIVDELEAKYKLEKVDDKLKRIVEVNNVINSTIINISEFDPDKLFEDAAAEDNKSEESSSLNESQIIEFISLEFSKIIAPFTDNMDVVFSLNKGNFTIGIFMDHGEDAGIQNEIKTNPFLLRDDFEIEKDIPNDFGMDQDVKGWLLEFQSFLRSSQNNNRYEINQFRSEFDGKIIICKPLKVDRGFITQNGVVFIISEKEIEELPFDLESIMKIFSSLISLWIELFLLVILSASFKSIGKALFKAFSSKSKTKIKENKVIEGKK